MRQRVMIAMALACEPKLLIADEPTTALDVTIQAQILELLRELRRERGTALILITHDLGVVAGMCERVTVMYAGKIVETATADESVRPARAIPYTLGLLQSVPRLDVGARAAAAADPGRAAAISLSAPAGCPFAPRCRSRVERCRRELPPLVDRSSRATASACFNPVTPDAWAAAASRRGRR